MPKYVATMTRKACQRLAEIVVNGTPDEVEKAFRNLARRMPKDPVGKRNTWKQFARKFARWVTAGMPVDSLPFKAFKYGNSKLPFLAFSSLPGVTCPGAGECLEWCYSFRGWRYPAAFFRQCQNTLLLQSSDGRRVLADTLRNEVKKHNKRERRRIQHGQQLPAKPLYFRLYVDGDFANNSDVGFWFETLRSVPTLKAYGYSKSWELLRDYAGQYPSNYKLNLSSGSKYAADETITAEMMGLTITRGMFNGVPLSGKYAKGFARFEDANMHAEVRSILKTQYPGLPVFSCTGKCGECTAGEHACGSDRFDKVLIGIGIHG